MIHCVGKPFVFCVLVIVVVVVVVVDLYYHTLDTLLLVLVGASCALSWLIVSCKLPNNKNKPFLMLVLILIPNLVSYFYY